MITDIVSYFADRFSGLHLFDVNISYSSELIVYASTKEKARAVAIEIIEEDIGIFSSYDFIIMTKEYSSSFLREEVFDENGYEIIHEELDQLKSKYNKSKNPKIDDKSLFITFFDYNKDTTILSKSIDDARYEAREILIYEIDSYNSMFFDIHVREHDKRFNYTEIYLEGIPLEEKEVTVFNSLQNINENSEDIQITLPY